MKKIIITKKNSGQRIDKFLTAELFSYSRGEIIRKIKNGEIGINSKIVKPSYILKKGDKIDLNIKVKNTKLIPNKNIKIKIIYQDENIVAINKPAGLKVHPNSFTEKNTLVNFLIAKFPEIKTVHDNSPGSELRPGIVHRLDKDTSGVMVITRNQKAFEELKKLFRERKAIKKYVALVHGKLKNKSGVIKAPIARAASYKKQVIAGRKTKTKIRPAMTEYKVLEEFEGYSLVEAVPKTGRMHQIRIHFFSLGNPIAGDNKYKLKKFAKAEKAGRHLLHAKQLEFQLGTKKYSFQSRLPEDFDNILLSLD